MNKKLKNALKEGFQAPTPMKKKEFFHNIPSPSISYFEFIRSQICYIRKWSWAFSVVIFLIAWIGASYLKKDMLWYLSTFMPLLALSIITESGRSELYGMTEFELATRFSLKSIVLARLGIVGMANFIFICLLTPFAFMNHTTNLFQTSIYLFCPYLLTVFLGLLVVRKVHSKEAIYLCVGIAVSISCGYFITYQLFPILYMEYSFIGWIIAFIMLSIGTVSQCYKMLQQTEELTWNLS